MVAAARAKVKEAWFEDEPQGWNRSRVYDKTV
jgi:hypothetical protein